MLQNTEWHLCKSSHQGRILWDWWFGSSYNQKWGWPSSSSGPDPFFLFSYSIFTPHAPPSRRREWKKKEKKHRHSFPGTLSSISSYGPWWNCTDQKQGTWLFNHVSFCYPPNVYLNKPVGFFQISDILGLLMELKSTWKSMCFFIFIFFGAL